MKEIKTWENATEESMTIEDEISDVLLDSADENAEQSDTIFCFYLCFKQWEPEM